MPAGVFGAELKSLEAAARPKPTITCYICGREYGSTSYGIHEKQCIEKYTKAQKKLPAAQRRPLPSKPRSLAAAQQAETGAIVSLDPAALEALHEDAFKTFMDEAREACPNCSRKFLPDRLPVHLRSCTPNGFFAKQAGNVPASRPVTSQAPAKPKPIVRPPSRQTASSDRPVVQKVASPIAALSQASSAASSPSTPAPAASARFCGQCGHQHGASDAFCCQCGTQRAAL